MVKKNHLLLNKSEIICIFYDERSKSKEPNKIVLGYNDLRSISIKPCRERKGFKVVESERIIVRSPKLHHPVEYYKYREKELFDDYKSGLRLFCKTNKVMIYDEVED